MKAYNNGEVNLLIASQVQQHELIPTLRTDYPQLDDLTQKTEFQKALAEFRERSAVNQVVCPINLGDRFTGLHITREGDGKFRATYVDPLGSMDKTRSLAEGFWNLLGATKDDSLPLTNSSLPYHITKALETELGIKPTEIVATSNKLQPSDSAMGLRGATNHHDGAFTSEILIGLAKGHIVVKNKRLQERSGSGFIDVADHNARQSHNLGVRLEKHHAQILEQTEKKLFGIEEAEIEDVDSPDFESFEDATYQTENFANFASSSVSETIDAMVDDIRNLANTLPSLGGVMTAAMFTYLLNNRTDRDRLQDRNPPTMAPVQSIKPSMQPSFTPTSLVPTTTTPSEFPTGGPTSEPSNPPSYKPTTLAPTSQAPTSKPSKQPTTRPSSAPTGIPSSYPTARPSVFPTANPSIPPSNIPFALPTQRPSSAPTIRPSTSSPSQSASPTELTTAPTSTPSPLLRANNSTSSEIIPAEIPAVGAGVIVSAARIARSNVGVIEGIANFVGPTLASTASLNTIENVATGVTPFGLAGLGYTLGREGAALYGLTSEEVRKKGERRLDTEVKPAADENSKWPTQEEIGYLTGTAFFAAGVGFAIHHYGWKPRREFAWLSPFLTLALRLNDPDSYRLNNELRDMNKRTPLTSETIKLNLALEAALHKLVQQHINRPVSQTEIWKIESAISKGQLWKISDLVLSREDLAKDETAVNKKISSSLGSSNLILLPATSPQCNLLNSIQLEPRTLDLGNIELTSPARNRSHSETKEVEQRQSRKKQKRQHSITFAKEVRNEPSPFTALMEELFSLHEPASSSSSSYYSAESSAREIKAEGKSRRDHYTPNSKNFKGGKIPIASTIDPDANNRDDWAEESKSSPLFSPVETSVRSQRKITTLGLSAIDLELEDKLSDLSPQSSKHQTSISDSSNSDATNLPPPPPTMRPAVISTTPPPAPPPLPTWEDLKKSKSEPDSNTRLHGILKERLAARRQVSEDSQESFSQSERETIPSVAAEPTRIIKPDLSTLVDARSKLKKAPEAKEVKKPEPPRPSLTNSLFGAMERMEGLIVDTQQPQSANASIQNTWDTTVEPSVRETAPSPSVNAKKSEQVNKNTAESSLRK